jgi:hypothetical protein
MSRCRPSHTSYLYRCSLPGLAEFKVVRRKDRHNRLGALGAPGAEREGFEPSFVLPKHAFQACALNHSATSPGLCGALGTILLRAGY